jgi:hypothetical protein
VIGRYRVDDGTDNRNSQIESNRLKTAVHDEIFASSWTHMKGRRSRRTKGGQFMEIKSLTEQQKRALAEISIVVYGEELTRIMIPELKDYLNGSTKLDDSPVVINMD